MPNTGPLQHEDSTVTPAHLQLFAIYNPQLGTSNETFANQLVFCYSSSGADGKRDRKDVNISRHVAALRHIGLAQGIAQFSRNFSDGRPAGVIETGRSRVVIHELEPGWWITVSIQLTRIVFVMDGQKKVEYSAREATPSNLLIKQLVRAHRLFLLHNGPSLAHIYSRISQLNFSSLLEKYWMPFATRWDVMLHGNPALDFFHATPLAAGGELGIGVGEEEWGSGEREVLEDFVRRTDGLIEIVVSRYGASGKDIDQSREPTCSLPEPWLGAGHSWEATDGVVFSGVGTLSKQSLRDISDWLRTVFIHGRQAYGILNPRCNQCKGKGPMGSPKQTNEVTTSREPTGKRPRNFPPGIPPPLVEPSIASIEPGRTNDSRSPDRGLGSESRTVRHGWAHYFRRIYEPWKNLDSPQLEQEGSAEEDVTSTPMGMLAPEPAKTAPEGRMDKRVAQGVGNFLIGLRGDQVDEVVSGRTSSLECSGCNGGITARTLYISLENSAAECVPGEIYSDGTPADVTRLRVVLYTHRPFMYTLLFNPTTPSLNIPQFYRDMHSLLSPLHQLLAQRTGPESLRLKLKRFTARSVSSGVEEDSNTWGLVYDPLRLTVCSNIPSIPVPVPLSYQPISWNDVARVDSLNVHSAILEALGAQIGTVGPGQVQQGQDRGMKTSKGWCVVRMHLDQEALSDEGIAEGNRANSAERPSLDQLQCQKEAIIVRRSPEGMAVKSNVRSRSSSGWAFWSKSNAHATLAGSGQEFDAATYIHSLAGLAR